MTDRAGSLRLINGRIYRFAEDRSPAEAIVVRDGKVAWVGATRDAPAAADTIDLQGASVLPGLTDAHIHLFAIAYGRLLVPLGRAHAASVGDVIARIKARAATTPKGEWVHAAEFDENHLAEHRYPTRDELDAAIPDHPVLIRRFCGHIAIVNGAALRALEIDEGISEVQGGVFGRGADGRLDGSATEAAAELIFRRVPPIGRATLAQSLHATIDDCLRMGMTAAVEAAVGFTSGFDEEFAVWQVARGDSAHLPMRLGFMHQLDPEEAVARGLMPTRDPDWQAMTLKFFADGIVGGRTSAVSEDYCDTPTRGFFMRPEADLKRVIVAAHEAGWQVAVHATGDRAVSCVIDAYETGQGRVAWPDPRHRIEHFFCPPRDGFARMQRLGALIVMQPSFLTRMRRSIEQAFGPRRHDKYPGRSALAAGVHYVASSDAPTGLTSPWAGMADAVDRGLPDGEPIGPNEALTPREAVAAYIHGGAYAMKQESWRGVLAPGMAADLIVPDRDPLTDAAPDLRSVNVLMTMVRGVIHHDAAFSRAGRNAASPAGR